MTNNNLRIRVVVASTALCGAIVLACNADTPTYSRLQGNGAFRSRDAGKTLVISVPTAQRARAEAALERNRWVGDFHHRAMGRFRSRRNELRRMRPEDRCREIVASVLDLVPTMPVKLQNISRGQLRKIVGDYVATNPHCRSQSTLSLFKGNLITAPLAVAPVSTSLPPEDDWSVGLGFMNDVANGFNSLSNSYAGFPANAYTYTVTALANGSSLSEEDLDFGAAQADLINSSVDEWFTYIAPNGGSEEDSTAWAGWEMSLFAPAPKWPGWVVEAVEFLASPAAKADAIGFAAGITVVALARDQFSPPPTKTDAKIVGAVCAGVASLAIALAI